MTPNRFWTEVHRDAPRPWVLFKHGTCVVLEVDEADPRGRATEILAAHGVGGAGGPGADFVVYQAKGGHGRMVSFSDPNIFAFVPAEAKAGRSDVEIGLIARENRRRDASDPVVVADSRSAAP